MASLFEVPLEPTTGLQTFAIFITFFFPALALVVIVVRDAGRLANKQFGLGTSPGRGRPFSPRELVPALTDRTVPASRRLARVDRHGENKPLPAWPPLLGGDGTTTDGRGQLLSLAETVASYFCGSAPDGRGRV